MVIAIFAILINIFLISNIGTIPNNDANCSISKLGCNCQNIEFITEDSVRLCCQPDMKTLLITGYDVKNISIDIRNSSCSKLFINLMIRETGIEKFSYPFYGLHSITNIYIEKNQNFSNFNKFSFSDINSKIDTISVEFNNIRSIGPKTFSNLPNLVSLKLSDNRIGFIDDMSFDNLTNLSSLYLNNNILTLLKVNTFYGLGKLKILSMLNNFITELSTDILKPLKNLQFFQLSSLNQHLSQVGIVPDKVFFAVKKLKHLNMTMKIKNLTALTFYGLTDLERLELQGNHLTVIAPGTFQQVQKVAIINLSRNEIRCLLPETFRNLPKLLSLDLSYNDLSYISDEVFSDISTLQTLDLSENNIYVIERNAFVGLKSLLLFRLNIIHGKAKNELQNNLKASPLAKLRKSTKIKGLLDYFGITTGYGEPQDIDTVKKYVKDQEWKNSYCPVAQASDKDWVDSSQAGSRKYLLIIVGICVVFLLIAFAIIMSYRAWSKRKMEGLSFDVDNNEKHEMLLNKPSAHNGRVDNQHHSKSSFTRKSLNGTYVADVIPDKNDAKADCSTANQTQQSNLEASVNPATCPLSNERNQSDDESALTPLGVL